MTQAVAAWRRIAVCGSPGQLPPRGVCSLTPHDRLSIGSHRVKASLEEMVAMSLLMWIIAALLLVAAAMLVAGVGAAGLWIGVIAVGIAVVAVEQVRRRHA